MDSGLADLIARKSYPKALELLQAQLARRPNDSRLRLKLADVLILAGRGREAVGILMGLADAEAADGFAAKAIAILKRIEKIEPGRRDVEERLAHLIQEKVRLSPGPTASATPAASPPEFGLEEFDPSADPLASAAPEPPLEIIPEPEILPTADSDLEDMAYLSEAEAKAAAPVVSTPLFEGFSEEELVAVIRGLRLLTFEPGDILVTEGAPGASLFILTTGRVKAFVKNARGESVKVHELAEGSFFGEISILTGRPRTATLTAAAPCEVLELDKATLDAITQTHPHVLEVLKRFHEARAQDTVEAIIRNRP
ncbi:MAG TPA: cyclic nucleotide-binding domain-containing protein [Vicinamibacteria bacterium]|nr:cyclic nucleotide-binding domain-containing protein [Vicinamibacteria bacterium]